MKQRIVLVAVALLAVAGLGWLGQPYRDARILGERAPEDRPVLALLTSLPLVFGEKLSLEQGGSAALSRLEQRYLVDGDACWLHGWVL